MPWATINFYGRDSNKSNFATQTNNWLPLHIWIYKAKQQDSLFQDGCFGQQ